MHDLRVRIRQSLPYTLSGASPRGDRPIELDSPRNGTAFVARPDRLALGRRDARRRHGCHARSPSPSSRVVRSKSIRIPNEGGHRIRHTLHQSVPHDAPDRRSDAAARPIRFALLSTAARSDAATVGRLIADAADGLPRGHLAGNDARAMMCPTDGLRRQSSLQTHFAMRRARTEHALRRQIPWKICLRVHNIT